MEINDLSDKTLFEYGHEWCEEYENITKAMRGLDKSQADIKRKLLVTLSIIEYRSECKMPISKAIMIFLHKHKEHMGLVHDYIASLSNDAIYNINMGKKWNTNELTDDEREILFSDKKIISNIDKIETFDEMLKLEIFSTSHMKKWMHKAIRMITTCYKYQYKKLDLLDIDIEADIIPNMVISYGTTCNMVTIHKDDAMAYVDYLIQNMGIIEDMLIHNKLCKMSMLKIFSAQPSTYRYFIESIINNASKRLMGHIVNKKPQIIARMMT